MTPREMRRFVQDQMRMGEDSSRIVRQLTDRGIDKRVAMQAVEDVSNQMMQAPLHGPSGGPFLSPRGSLAPVVLGGLLAGVVGGGIWTLVFIVTQDPVGIAAWGIGALCGFAVLMFARGLRGPPLQVIAVISTVIGILVGKYGSFFYVYHKVIADRFGEEAAAELSLFSPEAITAFAENITELVQDHDMLWMILAVATAWGIPKVAAQATADKSESR